MKMSNKVLIATILLSASIIFIIPGAVNIEYSSERHKIDSTHFYQVLNPAKTILIKNLPNCRIVPSGSFRIGFASNYMNEVLNLSSKDTLSLALKNSNLSDSSEVILYVPINKVDLIISYSSKIKLWGQLRRNEVPSYHLELHSSTVSLTPFSDHQFFDRLQVDDRQNSSIIIPAHNHIKDLILVNANKVSISPLAEISNVTTNFDSKASVKITRTNLGTEIHSNP